MERGRDRPGRPPPFRLHARGARPVPGHARGRAARVPRPAARDEQGRRGRGHRRLVGAARGGRPGGQQGRVALPRQPAAHPAGRRAGARPRPPRPRRAAGRARPDRDRRHRRRARRAGPSRALRAVLQPPAGPGRGPVHVGHDHRPRPAGRDRSGGRAGHQRSPPAGGPGRGRPGRRPGLGASPASRCPRSIGGAARLVLDASVDSDAVLRAAMAAGRVTEFTFERRRLSEVFREALG